MSNRSTDFIYKRSKNDRQVLSKAEQAKTRRIVGSVGQRSNAFRLSDIHKLIAYRHNGQCYDDEWMRRYFRAALPHVLSDARRIVVAGGSYDEAMISWVTEHVPLLRLVEDDAWISEQVEKHLAKPQRRRCPRVDRTARILQVQDGEPEAAKLCSIPAMSRDRKVREADDRVRRAQAERDRRARVEGYTPREQSKASQIRAAGENPSTVRSREYRARKAAEKAAELAAQAAAEETRIDLEEGPDSDAWWDLQITKAARSAEVRAAMQRVSCPDLCDVQRVSCPTWVDDRCNAFRALHLEYPQAPFSDLVREVLNPCDLDDIHNAQAWITDASTACAREPLPTAEQHAATMTALIADADRARAEWASLQRGWNW